MAVEVVNKKKDLLLLVWGFARNIDAFSQRYFSRYLTYLDLKKRIEKVKKTHRPEKLC